MRHVLPKVNPVRALLVCALGALCVACGDYGGQSKAGNDLFWLQFFLNSRGPTTSANDVGAFSQTVYPIVRDNCDTCHAGAGPGAPHIAHPDTTTAYRAVVDQRKVSLSNPAGSRLVQRLVTDRHYCWTPVCADDGAVMQAAIEQWSEAASDKGVATEDTLASTSLSLDDGVDDPGAQRYVGSQIALWEFKEGAGDVARDTSGVSPAIDLTLRGNEIEWMTSYGLEIESGRAIADAGTSRKLYNQIGSRYGSGQYSVEMWARAEDIDQDGPARMLSYSDGPDRRNFMLGQEIYNFDYRNRSMAAGVDGNGMPTLQTAEVDQDLQAVLQHVVLTYDLYHGRQIFVNGAHTGDRDPRTAGRLWNWDPNHRFVIGSETNGRDQWRGQMRMAAVHSEALTIEQIQQNYNAGVGKRLLLRFDVGLWAGPGSVLEMEVSEFDDYSYLFCNPTFIKDGGGGVRVGNIRIAVNGEVPVSGQAFRTLDVTAAGSKSALSPQCSLIPKGALGAEGDRFTLVFERLGGFSNVIEEPPPPPPPPVGTPEPRPDSGIRDFARVNETFAALTGVDPSDAGVEDTFLEVEQALPANYDVRAFASAQQVSIAKLALEYCDGLVEDVGLRDAFFGLGFPWNSAPAVAFVDSTARDLVFDPLIDGLIGTNLLSHPGAAEVKPVLNTLVDELLVECATTVCDAGRTQTVVKASCAAVLASGAVSIH